MGYSHVNSKGLKYHLNRKAVTLKNGAKSAIYYFSKDEREDTSVGLPEGYSVSENSRSGLPCLKKTNV